MKSLKLKGENYWDTSGVYDSALGKTQAEINGGVDDLKSAVNYSVLEHGNNKFTFSNVAWEQGAFNSGGDTDNPGFIRTGHLHGGFLIHNKGGAHRYIVAAINTLTGALSYPYMTGTVYDEWYYIPPMFGYTYRMRQAKISGNIIPSENTIDIYMLDEMTGYSYTRSFCDITSDLQWEHATIDENGAKIQSDYNIMAELPNAGSVEIKMNRPDIKFRVYLSTAHPAASGGLQATLLQDWSNYFYRYTPEAGGHLHYFVVVALMSGGVTTSDAYTAGRRGIKVYMYTDFGSTGNTANFIADKTLAAIGDSIVQGRCSVDATSVNTVLPKPWIVLLAEKSRKNGGNYGIGSATVYGNDWMSLYTNRNKVTGYDVVFICGGTNDHASNVSEADFKSAYTAVITALKANNTTVIAVTPPARVNNYANTGGLYLADYARFVTDVCAGNTNVIDLYTMTNNDNYKSTLSDGLHPNAVGHKMICDYIIKALNT